MENERAKRDHNVDDGIGIALSELGLGHRFDPEKCELVIGCGCLNEGKSLVIKSALANPACKLKSLSLNVRRVKKEIISNIGCGLNQNTSIEHLYYEGESPESLLSYTSTNITLQKLELYHIAHNRGDFYNLPAALKQCRALKSFSLGFCSIGSKTWNAIVHAVFELPYLEEFSSRGGLCGDSLEVLSECMRKKPLKSLDLSDNCRITSNSWDLFFEQLSEVGLWLESINLAYNNGIDDCVDALVQFLDYNMKLKSLDLRDEDDILSASSWKRVLGVLHRTSITKLSGICCYDNTVLPEIFFIK